MVRRWYGLDTGLVYPWWVEAFFVEQSVHRPLLVEVYRQTLFGEKCCLLFVNFVLCLASSFTSFLSAKISIFLQFSPQKKPQPTKDIPTPYQGRTNAVPRPFQHRSLRSEHDMPQNQFWRGSDSKKILFYEFSDVSIFTS